MTDGREGPGGRSVHWAWALILGGTLALGAWVEPARLPAPGCPLRRLSGVPCPACGATRAFHDAGRARWKEAANRNPLAFLAYFAAWAGLAYHLAALAGFRRRGGVPGPPGPMRRAALPLGAVLLLAFWAFQLRRGAP